MNIKTRGIIMRIVVIGAVAAGTSAAAKARRNDDLAEIIIYEKDQNISYSGCGLPYYIGGEVKDIEELTPRDSAFFKGKYEIKVKTEHEVMEIDKDQKTLLVKNLGNGEVLTDSYDKLIIATGASPFVPKVEGINHKHVFFLRNVQNAVAIKNYMNGEKPITAVIAGTGFIGFEVLENLLLQKIDVTIVEVADKITPNLDVDMATYLENLLLKNGVKIIKSKSISTIHEKSVVLSDGQSLSAEMVIMATGVRPNTKLAQNIGITLGKTGAIQVDEQMKTNVQDIYACGDCIETFSAITGKPVYRPLGSTANKTGRIAGDALTGGDLFYKGNLGTGIFKLFDLTIASTGLSEKEAIKEGFDIDLDYAPPFSTTKDPVHYTGMILDNAISHGRKLITADALRNTAAAKQIIDARSEDDYLKKDHVADAIHLSHEELREKIEALDPEKMTVTYCNKGVTGNAAQNILLSRGFKNVYNLSGGHKFYAASKSQKDTK